MINVKYCAPALDYSGYGEASRHDIGALTSVGVNVVGDYTKHCLEIGEFGELGQLAQECLRKNDECDIKILHTTPNLYGRFIEPGKYHIGRVFWETDKLPPDFARGVAMVQEIWTGSEFNAQAIRNAGITHIPIHIIPEAIGTPAPKVKENITSLKDTFTFYSIFEWTERKNPRALLESFWREFEGHEDVALVLKSYVDNFTPEKRNEIKRKFDAIKDQLNLKEYPPVYLYTHMLSRSGIYRFHKTFDCYVSAHRGEGWGIPQMEALLMGKPVVSTACGGIHEHIGDIAQCVPYTLVGVKNVDRNGIWYLPEQKWAEVDVTEFRKSMRYVYENQAKEAELAPTRSQAVEERFGLQAVGAKMLERLELISKERLTTARQQ